mgnify:CR=1 FL=1
MSRIGKKPVPIPEKVDVKIEGNSIRVKGPKGELSLSLPMALSAERKENQIELRIVKEEGRAGALHGLFRAMTANMITGVTTGYTKRLELFGVGYRAAVAGKDLSLQLGFSHPVVFHPPDGITLSVEGQNKVVVGGIDKQKVGQVAAEIRNIRPVEPYKGKGVRYEGEQYLKKAGKAAKAAGGAGGAKA